MSRKNVVDAFDMIVDGDMSANITQSTFTDVRFLDNANIRVTWDAGGTPVGTLVIQAKQVKQGRPEEAADWFDVDFNTTIVIDNTATEHQIHLTQLPFTHIRVKYIRTSGTGTLNARLTARQIGG